MRSLGRNGRGGGEVHHGRVQMDVGWVGIGLMTPCWNQKLG